MVTQVLVRFIGVKWKKWLSRGIGGRELDVVCLECLACAKVNSTDSALGEINPHAGPVSKVLNLVD